jgi:hypothetical protein
MHLCRPACACLAVRSQAQLFRPHSWLGIKPRAHSRQGNNEGAHEKVLELMEAMSALEQHAEAADSLRAFINIYVRRGVFLLLVCALLDCAVCGSGIATKKIIRGREKDRWYPTW